MKRNQIVLLAALVIFSVMIGACTRSASGGASDAPEADTTLPNPVSTQSQLMKDIIAGTQTAMAVPLDATLAAGTEVADTGDDDTTVDATAEPKDVEPTAKPLPTSTPGPAPVVALEYNTNLCETRECTIVSGQLICCCIVSNTKDKDVTVQVSNPFFANGTEVSFLMAPEGQYDLSKYVLAAVSEYKPAGDGKNYFKVVLTIPDSLRGTNTIVVRADTENPIVYAQAYFPNK